MSNPSNMNDEEFLAWAQQMLNFRPQRAVPLEQQQLPPLASFKEVMQQCIGDEIVECVTCGKHDRDFCHCDFCDDPEYENKCKCD